MWQRLKTGKETLPWLSQRPRTPTTTPRLPLRPSSVVDPHHANADPDSTYNIDAEPYSDFYLMRIRIRLSTLMRIRIQILASNMETQTLGKVLKYAHIPYIMACHLKIDADPDPAYHFDADPDADPDPDFYLMRIRIQVTKMMRIHADPDPQHCDQDHGHIKTRQSRPRPRPWSYEHEHENIATKGRERYPPPCLSSWARSLPPPPPCWLAVK